MKNIEELNEKLKNVPKIVDRNRKRAESKKMILENFKKLYETQIKKNKKSN